VVNVTGDVPAGHQARLTAGCRGSGLRRRPRQRRPRGVQAEAGQAQIQGDELRVSSKKRDDLQAIRALARGQDYDFVVQVTNYR